MTQMNKTMRVITVIGIGLAIASVGVLAEAATGVVISAIFDASWWPFH
jgi:hypothetical protein